MPNNYISHLKIYYRKFKDRIERNSFAGTDGWIIGGPKGMLAPTLKLLGGPGPPWPPPPLPTPMDYTSDLMYSPIIIQPHSYIWYDITSNELTFQVGRVKVNVTVVYFHKRKENHLSLVCHSFRVTARYALKYFLKGR